MGLHGSQRVLNSTQSLAPDTLDWSAKTNGIRVYLRLHWIIPFPVFLFKN